MSIITNGLGSTPSNLILGSAKLGFIEVIVEPEPPIVIPPQTVTGGVGGDYKDIRPRHKVTFIIRHKTNTWEKEYIVEQGTGNIIIRILNVWSKVKNKINITIQGVKKKLGNIRIKIK